MPDQVLVNVINVNNLLVGGQVTLSHGLKQEGQGVTPTLIFPDRVTGIAVLSANDTDVTFVNNGTAISSARFRCEYGMSMEVDHDILPSMYSQGGAGGGGAGTITQVNGSGRITSSAPAGPTTNIGLSNTGVVAGSYGNAVGPNESLVPTITVLADGGVSAGSDAPIRIGGTTAKSYVDTADAATLAAANAYAEGLAFSIASKQPAHVATTAALPAYTVDATFKILTGAVNGAFPLIDGQTILVTERVLVKDEAGALQPNNGIYSLTNAGSAGSKWILTRTADADTAQELCGSLISVETGSTNGGTVWLFGANPLTFTLGTTPVIWGPISVPAASTTAPGIVQLAGGLGGAGSVATAPTLHMDFAASGTLAVARGGTGGNASPTLGAVAYGTGTAYAFTGVGTPGQVLTSQGAGAPIWTTPTTGTVTSISAGTGLTGGTVTGIGTFAVDFGTGAGKVVEGNDTRLNPTPGVIGKIIYDAGGNYAALAVGAAGQVLTSQGAGLAPVWAAVSAGTVTSVSVDLSSQPYISVANGTTTPVISVNIGQAAGTIAAGGDSRFNPLPSGAGKMVYDTGAGYSAIAAGTSSQVLLGGAVPSWGAVDLATMVTGTLASDKGGTGFNSYAQGDILYAAAAGSTLSKLPAGSNGQYLTLAGGVPAWGTVGGGGGSGSSASYVSQSANYTASPTDFCIDCTTGTFTVQLPAAATAGAGRMYVIKNSGTGVITIDANGAETIDGALTLTMSAQYTAYTLMCTGTSWVII